MRTLCSQHVAAPRVQINKILGKGSYGNVYEVQRQEDGKLYAMKEIDIKAMSQADRQGEASH